MTDSSERPVRVRGVRGAIVVDDNSRDAILTGARELLALMIRTNSIDPDDVASAFLTTTPDLNAEFPALAARQLGWGNVPLLCGHEMTVEGALRRCVRILVHWNTSKGPAEIRHIYARGAESLRPDMQKLPAVDWAELEAWIKAEAERFGFEV